MITDADVAELDEVQKEQMRTLCWETMFGQELTKLTVMDLVLTVVSTVGAFYVILSQVTHVSHRSSAISCERSSFVIATAKRVSFGTSRKDSRAIPTFRSPRTFYILSTIRAWFGNYVKLHNHVNLIALLPKARNVLLARAACDQHVQVVRHDVHSIVGSVDV